MSNWSGVYSNPNSTGISTGMNGSNTLVDNTANFPYLPNQYLKITAGLGVGQERKIANNGTTYITIWGSWDTIPDDTSHYEIVLRLMNEDHITNNIYFRNNIITELENNATIFIDGNYKITIDLSDVEIRWNKSKNTLVTFEPNNREIQGTFGFWGGVFIDDNTLGSVKISYIRIRNSIYGIQIEPNIALGDGQDIHHIIAEECSSNPFGIWGVASLQNIEIKNILALRNFNNHIVFATNESIYNMTYDKVWVEDSWTGIYWGSSGASNKVEIFKNSVFKNGWKKPLVETYINNADKKFYQIDNYIETHERDSHCGHTSGVSMKGKWYHHRSVLKLGYEIANGGSDIELEIRSRHNDLLGVYSTQRGLYNVGVGNIFTSHSDFIEGRREGALDNIDISELITSDNSPVMYEGLSSARTNAKSTPNKLLECDNIRESDLTATSIKIKFDCKNSDTGTIIDQDSISGQKVLYITATSEFDVEETVEIGFGTTRQEIGIIDSIQDGISITLKENLTYTHTSIQADVIKKRLRNIGLGFVRYGLNIDNLNISTHLPDKSSWGFLYCGFKPDIEEDDEHEWKYTDLEANLTGLKNGTKYYYQVFAYTPLGDLMEGVAGNFTTSTSVDYTDPLETNVRESIAYKFAGVDKTGTLDLPAVVDVRDGIKFDGLSKEGISDQALESDVKKDVKYDNETKTGILEVSGLTAEQIYNYFVDGSRAEAFKDTGKNIRLFNPVYDTNHKLLSGTFKIYLNKSDCESDTNSIGNYSVIAEYNVNGELINFREVTE